MGHHILIRDMGHPPVVGPVVTVVEGTGRERGRVCRGFMLTSHNVYTESTA